MDAILIKRGIKEQVIDESTWLDGMELLLTENNEVGNCGKNIADKTKAYTPKNTKITFIKK